MARPDQPVNPPPGAKVRLRVAIAWMGLPHYAARVIQEARNRHPDWDFIIISSRDQVPYQGIEAMVGGKVHWVDSRRPVTWAELNEPMPDLFLITSWPHVAYRTLAAEAKKTRDTPVVVMFDNYLRYTAKQFLGFFYYRLVLQRLFSAAWVPGEYSRRLARFFGIPGGAIYQGLYVADTDVFTPPPATTPREGMVYVGQFLPRKGLRPLARVARQRREAGRSRPIRAIGQGLLADELKAAGLAVEPFKQPRELAEVYRESSALILASEIDHWGVVVHEAGLCGCLLLVTRHCGCAHELVNHRVNGYIMQNSSAGEILKAIAWWESLDAAAIARGRVESIKRANTLTPAIWAETLDRIVARLAGPSLNRAIASTRATGMAIAQHDPPGASDQQ